MRAVIMIELRLLIVGCRRTHLRLRALCVSRQIPARIVPVFGKPHRVVTAILAGAEPANALAYARSTPYAWQRAAAPTQTVAGAATSLRF